MEKIDLCVFVACSYTDTPSARIDNLKLLVSTLRARGIAAYLVQPRLRNTRARYAAICASDPPLWLTAVDVPTVSGVGCHVAIYPDVVRSNFLRSDNVIAYLMAHPAGRVPAAQHVLVHSTDIQRRFPGSLLATLNRVVEPAEFDRVQRCELPSRTLVYARKYRLTDADREGLGDFVDITSRDNTRPANPGSLFSCLRSGDLLVVFEPTRVIMEALCLGCPVVFVRNPSFADPLCELTLPGFAIVNDMASVRGSRPAAFDPADLALCLADNQRRNAAALDLFVDKVRGTQWRRAKITIPFSLRPGLLGTFARTVNSMLVGLKRAFAS